jgi:hypothetical protein
LPLNDPFFLDLVNLIKSIGFQEDANLAVYQLKLCENIMLAGAVLTTHEKRTVGMISSIIKQFLYTIHTQGLVVGNFILKDTGNDIEGFWDCFDSLFSDRAGQNLGVLGDAYNAGSMIAAWSALLVTLAVGVGNAISSTVADCW